MPTKKTKKSTIKRYKKFKTPPAKLVAQHQHTGHILPKHHTSYALLTFLLLLFGVFLVAITTATRAADISVTAAYLGQPPSEPAVITSPSDGSTFETIPQTFSGTCPAGEFVKLYRNDVFTGSQMCDVDGNFSITTDLFEGENEMRARIFNGADVEGPESPTISVTYNPPEPPPPPEDGEDPDDGGGGSSDGSGGGTSSGGETAVKQLALLSDLSFHGYRPNELVRWPIEIVGGKAPYALIVNWGDGETDLISRAQSGSFYIEHRYSKPGEYKGSYKITVKASDNSGQEAYLQLVAIVNDPSKARDGAATTTGMGGTGSGDEQNALRRLIRTIGVQLRIGWPLYIVLVLMVSSFWLGERRLLGKLKAQQRLRKV